MPGPSFRAAPVRVRVPATSANLGPGFDAVALALGLHDDVVVRIGEAGLHVEVAGEGAGEVDGRPERNLVVRALRTAFDALGGRPRGLEVVCANRIPHARGLGSSAAAIVAGVVAARELVLGGMPDEDALALAAGLEGHHDNVAACLYGGLTVAWDGGLARFDPHPSLRPVVLVPQTKGTTAKARRLLPDTVPHADAARNAGRAALLVTALTERPELLLAATEDTLHQPYRLPAMPRTATLLTSLRGKGIAAVVSGSGPTVLALATSPEQAETAVAAAPRGWAAAELPVASEGARPVPL